MTWSMLVGYVVVVGAAVTARGCGDDGDRAVDAGTIDAAPPPDAASTGRLLVSWAVRREGVADPIVTCADLGAETVTIEGGTVALERPCADELAAIEDVPPGTLDLVVTMWRSTPGGALSRLALRPAGPVTVVVGRTTYVPLVFRLFDEPGPQLRQIVAGATAFYAASAPPRVFPSGVPDKAPPAPCMIAPEGICQPDPSWWTAPPFSQLGFRITGLSRFMYQFSSSGSGPDATFTVRAIADYDADGATRTYTIDGRVAHDGTVVSDAIVVQDDD